MIITLADAELWRYRHELCFKDGVFRSPGEARFVINAHGGHGPTCMQYLSAAAYWSGHGGDDDE